jgi:hypothetical protein
MSSCRIYFVGEKKEVETTNVGICQLLNTSVLFEDHQHNGACIWFALHRSFITKTWYDETDLPLL